MWLVIVYCIGLCCIGFGGDLVGWCVYCYLGGCCVWFCLVVGCFWCLGFVVSLVFGFCGGVQAFVVQLDFLGL